MGCSLFARNEPLVFGARVGSAAQVDEFLTRGAFRCVHVAAGASVFDGDLRVQAGRDDLPQAVGVLVVGERGPRR